MIEARHRPRSSVLFAAPAVTPTLVEELHNNINKLINIYIYYIYILYIYIYQFQSGVTGRSSLPPCRQNMPALCRQVVATKVARPHTLGPQQQGFNRIFLHVFICPVHFSHHRPVVPLDLLPTQLCVRKLEPQQPPPTFDCRFMRRHARQGQPAKFAS